MLRTIIRIDEEKCNGCGLCAAACHEGAIAMVDGKAKLIRDDYCDGLGNCLPVCPTGAISFEEREALPYDEAAVKARQATACPGSQSKSFSPAPAASLEEELPSQLRQWPVQIRLAPLQAPYFQGAHLLIASDCSAFAHGDFHRRFMQGKVTLIGCPKLDPVDYREKLTAILEQNDIHSLTVTRMEVPCCGGLSAAVLDAVSQSKKQIPLTIVTLSIKGEVLKEETF